MRAPLLTHKRARSLRRNMSPPEAMLWTRLRPRLPGRPSFRRQHPVGPYILDFYCGALKLAVEIDGQGHDMGDAPAHDIRRSAWLRDQGIEIIRIPALDVLRNPDEVTENLWIAVRARMPTPPPFFTGVEGGRMATDGPDRA